MYVATLSLISGLYIVVQVCCTQFLSTSLLILVHLIIEHKFCIRSVTYFTNNNDAGMLPVNNGQINHHNTYQLAKPAQGE